MPSVFIEELDAESYATMVAREGSTIIIPTGATEQHGPHMPLGVDAMLSRAIAGIVAEKIGALVAPVFSYGYKSQPRSGGGNHRVGTTSLGAAALTGMVDDVVTSLIAQGFTNVVVLNGHFENYQFIYEGLDNAVARARATGSESRAVLLSYWDFVDEATLEKVFPDGFLGWDIEHGGVLETSLMLLLHPQKVDMTRVVDGMTGFSSRSMIGSATDQKIRPMPWPHAKSMEYQANLLCSGLALGPPRRTLPTLLIDSQRHITTVKTE